MITRVDMSDIYGQVKTQNIRSPTSQKMTNWPPEAKAHIAYLFNCAGEQMRVNHNCKKAIDYLDMALNAFDHIVNLRELQK